MISRIIIISNLVSESHDYEVKNMGVKIKWFACCQPCKFLRPFFEEEVKFLVGGCREGWGKTGIIRRDRGRGQRQGGKVGCN